MVGGWGDGGGLWDYIVSTSPIPFPLDFGYWIWDLDLGFGFGTGLGLDKNIRLIFNSSLFPGNLTLDMCSIKCDTFAGIFGQNLDY